MMGFYGMVFLISLFLQNFRGLSSLQTGLAFVLVTGFSIFVPVLAAGLAERAGAWLPISIGQISMAAGLISLSIFSRQASNTVLVLLMMPVGIGAGMAMPSATSLLLNSVPGDRSGAAGGILNTSRQIGGALGIAVFGTLIYRQGYEQGLKISLLIAVVFLLITAMPIH
jgi:DHA2 family methylenomycin A resistance protein-like MFS transporter